mgnify:CR=1 FL=1
MDTRKKSHHMKNILTMNLIKGARVMNYSLFVIIIAVAILLIASVLMEQE